MNFIIRGSSRTYKLLTSDSGSPGATVGRASVAVWARIMKKVERSGLHPFFRPLAPNSKPLTHTKKDSTPPVSSILKIHEDNLKISTRSIDLTH